MALAPKFAGQRMILGGKSTSSSLHTIELYLDYVCPYSAKMFKTLFQDVFPESANKPYADRVQFLFRQQIQPWHPSSTLCHESGVAVLKLAPTKFWAFSEKLFEQQTDFFDVNVVKEARNETYQRLAKIGADVGLDESTMLGLLQVPDKPGKDGALNVGNEVTNDLKLLVKAARLTGVHVSPTVIFNGVVDNSISSSFTAKEWLEWLEKNCA